jgi:hypothetical protein
LLPITDDAAEPSTLVEALRRILHEHWKS